MHRTAPRLARVLACAAVPVLLVAGCSSDSDSDSKSSAKSSATASAKPTAKPTPTVAPVKFKKLPKACDALVGKTVEKLVPNAESKKGKHLASADSSESDSCLWSGLEDYQYRSLTLSFRRFDSGLTSGSGDQRAEEYAAAQADQAAKVKDAKNVKTGTAAIGDKTVTVKSETKQEKEDFRNQTVVARTGNVVVIVEYDGAGFEDGDTPNADKLLKDAQDAAKEAVESVATADK
ncbi:hypothetical protein [Streptomyces sp. SAJ15]|uniref:hypothetical protein n=1 Tax=Streptomyces sp. SAJ15 TaxID=2011095 RepID=UPI001185AA13|nr:hypothetical protein [Streptomyces sp. SAJ15]TVL93522.1 hypothetical protein CD790_00140 [Streptomyces sp. SAJ15]